MPPLIIALYLGLVIVGALLLISGMYVHIDKLITAFAIARGMESECSQWLKDKQAKIDYQGEVIEEQKAVIRQLTRQNTDLRKTIRDKDGTVGRLQYALDAKNQELARLQRLLKERTDAS